MKGKLTGGTGVILAFCPALHDALVRTLGSGGNLNKKKNEKKK